MVADTFSNGEGSVFGDGTDDYGLANGPEQLPQSESFGVAFTFQTDGGLQSSKSYFGALEDVGTTEADHFWFATGIFGPTGDVEVLLQSENANRQSLYVYTDNAFNDGIPKACVINKSGNSAADIDIYITDMSTPVSKSVARDEGFTPGNYDNPADVGFFSRNILGAIDQNISAHMGIIEFNGEPYSQAERDNFVSRRPEV